MRENDTSQEPRAGLEGIEWLIDAHGCAPERLRSLTGLADLFARVVAEVGLHPVGDAHFHQFPGEGGITGLLMLSESHLACHTFPESGYAAFNLYCCRPRPVWAWAERLTQLLGAARVEVRAMPRPDGRVSR